MTAHTDAPANPASRSLPLVLMLFAAGGCAALIYEVVWYQMLQLAIGSSAVSLGILLATFMGGLCIGSLLLRRLPRGAIHPLRLYALIELGIGAFGVLVLFGVPLADYVYVAGLQSGLSSMLLRGLFCALVLMPPTMLMGASLPAISRFVEATPRGVVWWGWLYAGNTLGAVAGCLVAAFYLMRLHDMAVTTYAAVAINIVIAAAAYLLSTRTPASATAPDTQDAAAPRAEAEAGAAWPVYLAILISGATALGAEVIWTRQLAMMFDGTVYAFSIILAVFLVGLALGSFIAAGLLRVVRPRFALGWSQLLLVAGIGWAAYKLNLDLPFRPGILQGEGWQIAYLSLLRTAEALLPATLAWGASFPLALAAAAAVTRGDPARPVGAVYAANTVGGVIGALSVSLVLVVWIGTRDTQRLMLVLAACSGLMLLAPMAWRLRAHGLIAGLAAAAIVAGLFVWKLPAQPGNLIAYGRLLSVQAPYSQLLETAEGRNSSVAITRYDGALQISVAGHVEATNISYDMRLQRMVGHLPALLHKNPQKILGIGFGAGVSAGSFTGYPTVKSITVAELEPKVPPLSSKYFAPYDNAVYHDPRTRIVYDDGRHFLTTTAEKFDIIASDPLDVWVKGTATIYSEDYFRKVKEHLNPGGFFTLYVPLYESDEATVKSEIATFFKVFPNGTIWANTIEGRGYDLVLMGQEAPLKIDLDVVEARLNSDEYQLVQESMQQIGFVSATDLYSTYIGQRSDLADWIKDAQINTDRNLRLMYLAGWGINAQMEDKLYRMIVGMRRPPEALFTGDPERKSKAMRQIVMGGPP